MLQTMHFTNLVPFYTRNDKQKEKERGARRGVKRGIPENYSRNAMAVNQVFKIRASDGRIFVAENWLINKSDCLSVFFAYIPDSIHPLHIEVPSPVLEKIIEWCERHRHDDPDQEFILIPQWDAHFLRLNNGILFNLIEAAFRMGIQALLDIAVRAVANTLERTQNEVRIMLRVGGFEEEAIEAEEDVDVVAAA
ncbi:unnamed protein product [Caenorhabditis sp. 36 PRJEB53466]|nr:unnamed protein product [Caenorhabditis sp. 36 PRJEB53466]